MTIRVYGKQGCKLCKSAQKKLHHFLAKWGVAGEVDVAFMDIETESGAAESDYFDVFDVPTVILMKDEWEVIARWDGGAPPSSELEDLLRPGTAAAAA